MTMIAVKLITEYIEHWGQSDFYKMQALNNALKAAGINVVAYVDEEGYHKFRGEESEAKRALYFTLNFGSCFARTFEKTEQKVDDLIEKYRNMEDS